MSASDNLATVQKIYEAFGSGDVPTILDQLADEVDWAADAIASEDGPPWYGPRTTKDQVAEFFEQIGTGLDVTKFDIVDIAASDDAAMAFIGFDATVHKTGKSTSTYIHHYWHFNADGKVDRYRGSEDTAQTVAAYEG